MGFFFETMENDQTTMPHGNIEMDADALEAKFGELAPTYAENRSEAAELRGAEGDAEHWRELKEEVEQGDLDE